MECDGDGLDVDLKGEGVDVLGSCGEDTEKRTSLAPPLFLSLNLTFNSIFIFRYIFCPIC